MSERKATALLTTTGLRMLRIERMLRRARCVSFKAMRAECECSVATLKRDLRFLRDELGAPLLFDRRETAYRLAGNWAGVQAMIFAQLESV